MKGRKGSASENNEGLLIGDKYKITADKYNVTLWGKKTITGTSKNPSMRNQSKVGQEYWKEIYFFSTPKNALDKLVDLEVMETGFKDFETVCKKQDELYKLIQQLPDDLLPQLKER